MMKGGSERMLEKVCEGMVLAEPRVETGYVAIAITQMQVNKLP